MIHPVIIQASFIKDDGTLFIILYFIFSTVFNKTCLNIHIYMKEHL